MALRRASGLFQAYFLFLHYSVHFPKLLKGAIFRPKIFYQAFVAAPETSRPRRPPSSPSGKTGPADDNLRVRVLVPEKKDERRILAAAENTGEVQKRQDVEQSYHKGAGTRAYIDRQNQEKK